MSCSDCVTHYVQSDIFFDTLARTGTDSNLPLAGSIEITHRCNLHCKHCYVHAGTTHNELTTREILHILDKLADAGVLFLLVTGGEILMRFDFEEIYLHAKKRGFLIILHTNATLITRKTAEFLAAYPPRRIEITAYGHTHATYSEVTHSSHGFAAFRNGVQLLVNHKLPVSLKTMILKINQHDFEDIRHWAKHTMGLPFRFDAIVNPRLDGTGDVLKERIAPEDVARMQYGSDDEIDRFLRLRATTVQLAPDPRLFKCGAGVGSVHIDPQGRMHPCMLWRSTPYDFLNGTVQGWKTHVTALRKLAAPAQTACSLCVDRLACANCPATSLLETGIAGNNVDYYCRINEARVISSAVRDDAMSQHSA